MGMALWDYMNDVVLKLQLGMTVTYYPGRHGNTKCCEYVLCSNMGHRDLEREGKREQERETKVIPKCTMLLYCTALYCTVRYRNAVYAVCQMPLACDKCTCDSYFCGLFFFSCRRSARHVRLSQPRLPGTWQKARAEPRQMDGTILFGLSHFSLPLPIAETRTVCVCVCMRACVRAVFKCQVSASVQPESSLASLASLSTIVGTYCEQVLRYHRIVCFVWPSRAWFCGPQMMSHTSRKFTRGLQVGTCSQ